MAVQKWRYLAELTALSGLRCREALALHMDDVALNGQTITVTKTLDPVHKIVTAPKDHLLQPGGIPAYHTAPEGS